MNFKEIIKQEWEKEFPNTEDTESSFGESIFYRAFGELADRICARVWNQALDLVAQEVETKDLSDSPYESYYVIDKDSILKLKVDEQGTDTTEV